LKIEVETVSPVEKKVVVEIDPERVAAELEQAYAGLGRRVKLKGFRPGKAPRQVLERHFKDQVENEVIEKLVAATFREAVSGESLSPVAPPKVDLAEPGLGQGKPLRYTARVEVKPRLSPKDYRGLTVTKRSAVVTDKMVEDELTRIQDSMAQLVPIEGRTEAGKGDFALIDYEGSVNGKPFEGGKGEGVTVRVEPGEFVEGRLAALEGRSVGQTAEIDYAFPADYRIPELRSKVANFKVTLKGLKARQVPAIDDELAKDLGLPEVDGLAALQKRIRTDLEAQERSRSEGELRDALIREALKKNDFEVPISLVERTIDGMLRGAADRFARRGIDIRKMGLDVSRLRADMREQALFQVKGALLLEAIAETEKIEVTEPDLQEAIVKMAQDLKAPLAKVQQSMKGAEAMGSLKNKIREDKALAFLSSAATIEEASEASAEPSAR
jgi:trigger factor